MMIGLQHHTVTEEIQEGEGSVLYRAFHNDDRSPVMIKVLKAEFPSPRDLGRLRHEYAMLKDLDLPGVVKVLGLDKWKNGLALILEDFGGWPLCDAMRLRRLELDEILRVGAAVAEALGAIHRRHILHKDIRPQKIFVSAGMRDVKLIDFSISTRTSGETPSTTGSSALEGSLAYISPEQTGRMNRVVDHRSDLYSLGVTLYEMLTGTLPFTATTPMELVHSHIARTPVAPHELSPETPKMVSDIVMKLLSKAAEDRYQQGGGLKADLEECLRRWREKGLIEPFVLGWHDAGAEMALPKKLYGRDAGLARIASAFDRVSQGAVELLIVTGAAGIGKTALVQEARKDIARKPGYFISGSFDGLATDAPYSAMLQAFRSLVVQILAADAGERQVWKRNIERGLGSHGAAVSILVPEIERLIGSKPVRASSTVVPSLSRFDFAVQSFLGVVSTADHPVVLFLDNLQWADPASLRLIKNLLTGSDHAHLLVIGAYREDEVDASHPIHGVLSEIHSASTVTTEITLTPLSPLDIQDLLIGALDRDRGRVMPLAELLLEKTGGNPLSLSQLLATLHDEKLIFFEAGAFTWEFRKVRERMQAYDPGAYLASTIEKLSSGTRATLTLGACFGHRFDRSLLAALSNKTPTIVSGEIDEAIRQGFLLAGPDDPVISDRIDGETPGSLSSLPPEPTYEFSHPHLRRTFHGLLDEDRRPELNLQIGRHLLCSDRLGFADRFRSVAHLNLGAGRMTSASELMDLGRYNLDAGRECIALAAFEAAEGLFKEGLRWLGDPSFERDHALAFALHFGLARCAHERGRHEDALALTRLLATRARSIAEQADARTLEVSIYMRAGKVSDAVSVGLLGMALLGIDLPDGEEGRRAALEDELAQVAALLDGTAIADLAREPVRVDPDAHAPMRLVAEILPIIYFINPITCALFAAKQVHSFLKHGHSDVSAYVYAVHSALLSALFHRHAEAHEFAKLAAALQDMTGDLEWASKIHVVLGANGHFYASRRAMLRHFARAREAGLASGDLLYACYACDHHASTRFEIGDELGSVYEEVEHSLVLTRRAGEAASTAGLTLQRQTILSLMGATTSRTGLSDENLDEAAFVKTLENPGAPLILFRYYVLKLELSFVHENYSEALTMALEAERRAGLAVNQFSIAELSFYFCLTLAALHPAPAEEAVDRSKQLEIHRTRLASLAESCPYNFRHKYALVLAEIARISAEPIKAADLYDEAIQRARDEEFPRDEALANEIAAKFYLGSGRHKVARAYMTDAYYGYLRWGALAKVESLAERYAQILPESAALPGRESRASVPPGSAVPSTQRSGPEELFDLVAVMRAAQAIAREIVLDQVLERMMRIIVENAGAQRGVLLLNRDDKLVIEASLSLDPDKVQVGPPVPIGSGVDLPLLIVQDVVKTRSPVVLDDASRDERFRADPYVVDKRPRSILCLAMIHQRRLTGVLYLENNSTQNAFTPARVEICSLLSSQAAIAVENAILYAHVTDVTERLRRSNEELEKEVAARTDQLRLANDRLKQELVERERAEQARARLHDEVLRVQAERLMELSTPLIPIHDRVMVMPLIGTIDEARARQMVETALRGAQAAQAEFVILDITGVKRVDAGVASTLLGTTRALGLLGTQVVITGIRPAVAQTLVQLGIDMRAVVTKGTLAAGIAYAMGQSSGGRRSV